MNSPKPEHNRGRGSAPNTSSNISEEVLNTLFRVDPETIGVRPEKFERQLRNALRTELGFSDLRRNGQDGNQWTPEEKAFVYETLRLARQAILPHFDAAQESEEGGSSERLIPDRFIFDNPALILKRTKEDRIKGVAAAAEIQNKEGQFVYLFRDYEAGVKCMVFDSPDSAVRTAVMRARENDKILVHPLFTRRAFEEECLKLSDPNFRRKFSDPESFEASFVLYEGVKMARVGFLVDKMSREYIDFHGITLEGVTKDNQGAGFALKFQCGEYTRYARVSLTNSAGLRFDSLLRSFPS